MWVASCWWVDARTRGLSCLRKVFLKSGGSSAIPDVGGCGRERLMLVGLRTPSGSEYRNASFPIPRMRTPDSERMFPLQWLLRFVPWAVHSLVIANGNDEVYASGRFCPFSVDFGYRRNFSDAC